MKIRACILILIWSTLLIEPLSASVSIKTPYSSCSKKQKVQSSCSKSKCSKSNDKDKEDDCKNNRCNPLMSCPTGNFYLLGQPQLLIASLVPLKPKTLLINDNRILKCLAECWHPPEVI